MSKILFNVFQILRNETHQLEDRICIILEAKGKDLEEAISHCVRIGVIEWDAEIIIEPASTVDTPLLNYRQ